MIENFKFAAKINEVASNYQGNGTQKYSIDYLLNIKEEHGRTPLQPMCPQYSPYPQYEDKYYANNQQTPQNTFTSYPFEYNIPPTITPYMSNYMLLNNINNVTPPLPSQDPEQVIKEILVETDYTIGNTEPYNNLDSVARPAFNYDLEKKSQLASVADAIEAMALPVNSSEIYQIFNDGDLMDDMSFSFEKSLRLDPQLTADAGSG